MSNPLLEMTGLPPFSAIQPEHVESAIDALLKENRDRVTALLATTEHCSWENLVEPLEYLEDRLNRAWSPVSHMNSVVNSDALRNAYNACLTKLSDYATEMGQNRDLFEAFQQVADGEEYPQLSGPQQKIVDNALRDFRLSGIDLPEAQQQRYKEIMQELSRLTNKFSENLLDATNAWKREVSDESELAGLPESAVQMAKQNAEAEAFEGWLFNLQFPSYFPIITYADNRDLRRELYTAYVTRASDEGPHAGQWDNSELMEQILALRHEAAQLLGFANYAERSLATKMATNPEQVLQFLNDLAERSLPMARHDLDEVRIFARNQHGMEGLEAWDIPYYSEKLRQHKYAVSQEELKPYFPEDRVLKGMFFVIERLYGLSVEEQHDIETWHKDVRFFDIRSEQGELRGQFYLDLYARTNKRGGAWMDECISRHLTADGLQTPVAYLTCNFTAPIGDKPALFTHDEVQTLFHEFGHGLHHMLTRIDHPSVSGISGVPWDVVELPSQFMENWCWERDALNEISGHVESGEALPDDLYEKMIAARNFQSAMQMVRQLEFSLFDFRMHMEFDPERGGRIYELLNEVREEVSVIEPPSFNRFPHSFSHIFSGGYAAGYYSYKWAEVLSADAFSAFEESHIFDRETGLRFLSAILEQGGSREPMELFVEFRGREPTIDALLRHSGLAA
ncbi:oligopeptidase A [Solemya pervernicosa gill symbiont]|uniref:oligopeptidase A n=2 Tax=Gammaproteobacteria incertae sedis TaxID=118884 RepID=A0A1T2L7Z5_9GAMM|nr:oligopeptidase A [Candidatus Reidiella endopervernicosa]OOZ41228.1 oligopeptidase A [Solemya pervernicosa gill symbiont]QKQ25287.1 oligopeptidase A [Candidatus Reidiella endopervernicosa]